MGGLQKPALIILVLALFILSSLSVMAQYEKINTWIGNVTIGTNSSTNGAIVGGYIGSSSSSAGNYTVGSLPSVGDNMYILDISCDAGKIMFLKVWGINATWQTCSNYFENYTNLSVSLVAVNGACSYSSACSGSNVCCSGTSEVNDGTTSGTCKSTCAAAAAEAAAGGGGGGAGGAGGVAAVSQTTTPQNVAAGSTGEFSITKEELLVTKVEITITNAVSNAQLTVREASKPSDAPDPIAVTAGKVNKYLSITTTIASENIENVKISFSVPKIWFVTNDLDQATTLLLRYKSGAWEPVPTVLVGSDIDNYLFEATSSTLSTFAIIAKNKAPAPPEEEEKPAPPEEEEKPAPPEEEEKPAPPEEEVPEKGISGVLIAVIVLVVVAVAIYIYIRKRRAM